MTVSVGGIGLIAVGGLLIHAALTDQSPLADLRSILTTGRPSVVGGAPIGTVISAPVTSTGYQGATATTNSDGSVTNTNTYNGGTISITKPPFHPVVGTNG